MNLLTFFGAPALMLARTVRARVREGLSWRECLRQLHELGARSMWLVILDVVFTLNFRPSSASVWRLS